MRRVSYQLLAQGRWFSPGTPAFSTTKTGCHDIAEILLKVALNAKTQLQIHSLIINYMFRDENDTVISLL